MFLTPVCRFHVLLCHNGTNSTKGCRPFITRQGLPQCLAFIVQLLRVLEVIRDAITEVLMNVTMKLYWGQQKIRTK